jgi:hypothetical protein
VSNRLPLKKKKKMNYKQMLQHMNEKIPSGATRELAQTVIHTVASSNPVFQLSIGDRSNDGNYPLMFVFKGYASIKDLVLSLADSDVIKPTVAILPQTTGQVVLNVMIPETPKMRRAAIQKPNMTIDPLKRKKLIFFSNHDHSNFLKIVKYCLNMSRTQKSVGFNVMDDPDKNLFTVSCTNVSSMDLEYLHCLLQEIEPRWVDSVEIYTGTDVDPHLFDITLKHSSDTVRRGADVDACDEAEEDNPGVEYEDENYDDDDDDDDDNNESQDIDQGRAETVKRSHISTRNHLGKTMSSSKKIAKKKSSSGFMAGLKSLFQ